MGYVSDRPSLQATIDMDNIFNYPEDPTGWSGLPLYRKIEALEALDKYLTEVLEEVSHGPSQELPYYRELLRGVCKFLEDPESDLTLPYTERSGILKKARLLSLGLDALLTEREIRWKCKGVKTPYPIEQSHFARVSLWETVLEETIPDIDPSELEGLPQEWQDSLLRGAKQKVTRTYVRVTAAGLGMEKSIDLSEGEEGALEFGDLTLTISLSRENGELILTIK